MDTMRTVLIVAGAIVVAIVALKVLAIVTSIIFSLMSVVVLAAVVYVLFLIARSAIRGRRTQEQP